MNEFQNLSALDAHFKALEQIAERVRAQVAPVFKVQEALRESLAPLFEVQRNFQKAIESFSIEQGRWWESIRSIEVPRFELPELPPIVNQFAEFQISLQRLLAPAFDEVQKSFSELAPRTRETLLLLGAHGWYLDLQMPLPELWRIKNALSKGNAGESEDALVEYFDERLGVIEKSITDEFPHRAHLIKAAFNAHRRQEFELSIPVFLAQTDGICKEVVNQYLFIKTNKKPSTAIYVERIAADTYRAALLSPLAQTLPISASERERPAGFDALNRHTVLHGESLDYGSKVNSLKAISLINYVAHVLQAEKEAP